MESSGVFFSPPSPLRGRTPLTPLFEGGMQKSPVSTVLDLYRLDTRPLWGRRWGTPADFRQGEPSPPSPANPPGPALSSIARRFARAAPPRQAQQILPAQRWPARPSKSAHHNHSRAQRWPAEPSDGPPSAAKAKAAMSSEAVTVFWAPFPSTGKGLGIGAAPSPRGDGGEAYSAQGKWVPKGENRPRFSSFAASPCARAAQHLAAHRATCKRTAQRLAQAQRPRRQAATTQTSPAGPCT